MSLKGLGGREGQAPGRMTSACARSAAAAAPQAEQSRASTAGRPNTAGQARQADQTQQDRRGRQTNKAGQARHAPAAHRRPGPAARAAAAWAARRRLRWAMPGGACRPQTACRQGMGGQGCESRVGRWGMWQVGGVRHTARVHVRSTGSSLRRFAAHREPTCRTPGPL